MKQEELANDVCFIARSLGLAAYKKECVKGIKTTGFYGTYYRVFISGDVSIIPCRVTRRKAGTRKMNKNVLNVGIEVESIGVGDYYGFEIDGDKLFCLGDFTVTHNTSLVKAIASHFDMNVCMLNINAITDGALQQGLSSTPKNSVVIIEDFDSSDATKSRETGNAGVMVSDGKSFSMLSMTGILNALDGIVPLDDCILFLTTNHLDHIDPAIYRKGRVDSVIEIGNISGEAAKEYAEYIFPEYDFSGVEFKETLGCRLNQALLEGKDSAEEFLSSLENNDCVTLPKSEK